MGPNESTKAELVVALLDGMLSFRDLQFIARDGVGESVKLAIVGASKVADSIIGQVTHGEP